MDSVANVFTHRFEILRCSNHACLPHDSSSDTVVVRLIDSQEVGVRGEKEEGVAFAM
jgi:hypothetical protein